MKIIATIFVFTLLTSGLCKYLPEDSVVSVYTTQPTTSGTFDLDVYQQLAKNIAERLSSPFYSYTVGTAPRPLSMLPLPEEGVHHIKSLLPHKISQHLTEIISVPTIVSFYRLFGVSLNKTDNHKSTTHSLLSHLVDPLPTKPLDNELVDEDAVTRDVEELNEEALTRIYDKKPEKISLLYKYLPSKSEPLSTVDANATVEDVEEPEMTLDDVDSQGRVEGPLILILELFGSLFQLLYGAFESLWKHGTPTPSTDDKS